MIASSTFRPHPGRVTGQALSAVQVLMLAVKGLKQPAIECYTLYVSHWMNKVTLSYFTQETIQQ